MSPEDRDELIAALRGLAERLQRDPELYLLTEAPNPPWRLVCYCRGVDTLERCLRLLGVDLDSLPPDIDLGGPARPRLRFGRFCEVDCFASSAAVESLRGR